MVFKVTMEYQILIKGCWYRLCPCLFALFYVLNENILKSAISYMEVPELKHHIFKNSMMPL